MRQKTGPMNKRNSLTLFSARSTGRQFVYVTVERAVRYEHIFLLDIRTQRTVSDVCFVIRPSNRKNCNKYTLLNIFYLYVNK